MKNERRSLHEPFGYTKIHTDSKYNDIGIGAGIDGIFPCYKCTVSGVFQHPDSDGIHYRLLSDTLGKTGIIRKAGLFLADVLHGSNNDMSRLQLRIPLVLLFGSAYCFRCGIHGI